MYGRSTGRRYTANIKLKIHLDNLIQFPSDEEEQGHVAMAWRLPYRLIDGIKTMQGIKLLASYLTFTQVREIR